MLQAPSTMNVSELLDINGHIKTKLMSKPEGPTHMYNSTLEPVLFEKLHNIKLSHSVFKVTTFFQFKSTKAALEILLQHMHDFKENLKTLYLVTNNKLDHKSYDVRQHVLACLALLKLCTGELTDCKSQIAQLTTQVNNTSSTLDQTNPKCAKRGIIHSLLNFIFGDPNSSAEINTVKNNMAI